MRKGPGEMTRLIADIGGTNARFALAGPDGRYVTGQVLHVNGGLWMG